MKILITTDAYFPMTNGVAISSEILYKQLKANGHDVKILTLSSNGKAYISGDVYYLSAKAINVYPDAKIIKFDVKSKIIKQIINWEPDIIHSQTEFSTMVVAKYIRRKLEIPQIHTYHTMYEDYLKYIMNGKVLKKNTMIRLTRCLMNSMDTVIVPTDKVKYKLSSYKIPEDNIEIIPTGIDTSKFNREITEEEKEYILSQYNLSPKDKILVYVGRIAEEKNLKELMCFFKKALEEIPEMKFLIVGGGPYLDTLYKIIKELDILESVRFTGMIDPDLVYKYYRLGTIFMTASTSESQGLTYLEAMASGCSVLCRQDLCINNLIIDGETGFTYTNEDEFLVALKKLLFDIELRHKIQDNSARKIKLYSKESFGDNVIDAYYKTIEKCRESSPTILQKLN